MGTNTGGSDSQARTGTRPLTQQPASAATFSPGRRMPGSWVWPVTRTAAPEVAPGQQLGQVALAGLGLVLGLVGGGRAVGGRGPAEAPAQEGREQGQQRQIGQHEQRHQRTARLPR